MCISSTTGRGVSAQSAAAADRLVGTWAGTWEGAGSSGGLEMTLETKEDKSLAGAVTIAGESGYKASFKTLSFDGSKMTGGYDYPLDPAIEVTLAATLDGKVLTGTWSAREKKSGNEVAGGTWKLTKK